MAMTREFGLYSRRIFPWLNDLFCRDPQLERLRSEALAPARGRVMEIGFGSGLNLEFYPSSVTSIVALDPNEGMTARAKQRIARSPIPVELMTAYGESLPLESETCDTAVSTLTLCSVSDPAVVLHELRRVLRPGGRLLLLEHGLSEDARVARWQHRLNRIQNVLACGCNLNRPMANLVESGGFRFETLRKFYVPKLPRTHGWVTLGVAVSR
jgi:ubiquinone/menaquinone biosynthesis C-methylase UbiE